MNSAQVGPCVKTALTRGTEAVQIVYLLVIVTIVRGSILTEVGSFFRLKENLQVLSFRCRIGSEVAALCRSELLELALWRRELVFSS